MAASKKNIGIVYVMSCTQGLFKIGSTQSDQFETRMYFLESNGYKNFNGFKREFAVEVEDYQKKESLCHKLFDKSQVKIDGKGIEMFTVDLSLVKELLQAFGGKQIYPPVPTTSAIISSSSLPAKSLTKNSSVSSKSKALTFKDIGIPIGTVLTYKDDQSITVKTVDDVNGVEYKGQKYTISGIVTLLKKGGSWQGGKYLLYNGKDLVQIRAGMEAKNG